MHTQQQPDAHGETATSARTHARTPSRTHSPRRKPTRRKADKDPHTYVDTHRHTDADPQRHVRRLKSPPRPGGVPAETLPRGEHTPTYTHTLPYARTHSRPDARAHTASHTHTYADGRTQRHTLTDTRAHEHTQTHSHAHARTHVAVAAACRLNEKSASPRTAHGHDRILYGGTFLTAGTQGQRKCVPSSSYPRFLVLDSMPLCSWTPPHALTPRDTHRHRHGHTLSRTCTLP